QSVCSFGRQIDGHFLYREKSKFRFTSGVQHGFGQPTKHDGCSRSRGKGRVSAR
ncbi:unnamed protein product, partial [Rotaria sp. Silwood1]